MLADQFTAAAAAAQNTAAVDEIARLTWRAHSERQLADVEAEAVSVARYRPAEPSSLPDAPRPTLRPALGLPRACQEPPFA